MVIDLAENELEELEKAQDAEPEIDEVKFFK